MLGQGDGAVKKKSLMMGCEQIVGVAQYRRPISEGSIKLSSVRIILLSAHVVELGLVL